MNDIQVTQGTDVVSALEFYSGIGGLHRALSQSRVAYKKVLRAFDLDPTACKVYEANYGRGIMKRIDINTLTAPDLAALHANAWLLSPSCQPYTVLNPAAKGAADPRAQSFIHLIEDVLPQLVEMGKQPGYMLVENVAGFETSETRMMLIGMLQKLGYHVLELLLTPLQFGIPNSRLRYYLLARRDVPFRVPSSLGEDEHKDGVWRCIPGRDDTRWKDTRALVDNGAKDEMVGATANPLHSYLDDSEGADEFTIPDRVLWKWGRLFDIVFPSSRRSCCFTRGYTQLVERAGSVLQMNEDLDTTETFDKFLHAQSQLSPSEEEDEGQRRALLAILRPLRLRYFSPSELLRLFRFDERMFVWPEGVSKKSKYRLIGNSVNVQVVTELINYLFEV